MTQDVFLIIDDQKSIALLLKNQLEILTPLPVLTCHSLSEAKEILATDVNVVVCLSDLHLPDATKGEAIELLHSKHITTIVLTASYCDKTRKEMFHQKVADYVTKDSPASIHYAVQTAVNLFRNAQRRLWVLSSSHSQYSNRLVGLLRVHRFRVRVFESPQEMLRCIVSEQPDLILIEDTDHIGADIHGFVNSIRQRFNQSQLPMMVCEPGKNIATAIRLMKYGVNDFYNTEASAEELYVRIKQNIDHSCAYHEIEHISQRDPLTGIFNRGYLFQKGSALFDRLKQGNKHAFVMMADIDHFKHVNDEHGHQKGDEAIIFTACAIEDLFSHFITARFGGEEFCVVGEVNDAAEIERLCETLRVSIEKHSKEKIGVEFTLSQGLTYSGSSLTDAIAKADKALYRAKKSGRNKVSVEY